MYIFRIYSITLYILATIFLNIIYTCNQDWHTAGDDRPTNPPPKLEVEEIVYCCFFNILSVLPLWITLFYTFNPLFQCYQCDSTHENCTENQMGEAVFCGDEMNGCLISRGDNPYKSMSVYGFNSTRFIVEAIIIVTTSDFLFQNPGPKASTLQDRVQQCRRE